MGSVMSTVGNSYYRGTTEDETSEQDLLLPEHIWIEILSYVSPSDLLNNCVLVCHEWNNLIQSHGVWKRKCSREGRRIPSLGWKEIPDKLYRLLYIYNPFERNLLKNPCGEEGLKHWFIHCNDGDGWIVEEVPQGADEVPREVGSTRCFATSYGECTKYQVISLLKEGLTEEIIDEYKPPIYVGEWHAARFDCGSAYKLVVALLDHQLSELETYEFGPYIVEQWGNNEWTKVSHVFKNYKDGVRFVGFEHSGHDTQFWAGHYGSKMTGAFIQLYPP